MGHSFIQQMGSPPSTIIQLFDILSGVYVVNINYGKENKSRKIFIK